MMSPTSTSPASNGILPILPVSSSDEWSPLRSVIVGRASNSMFPSEPPRMMQATMPLEHQAEFRANNPFPAHIVAAADAELDNFAAVLRARGIAVHRPAKDVDWAAVGGYTGAMVRDGLLVVGNTVIEAAFSWRCRAQEVDIMLEPLLRKLAQDERVRVVRAPKPPLRETLLDGDGTGNPVNPVNDVPWAINNSRVAFDAADFLRLGRTLVLGRLSHVTNMKGVEWVRSNLPDGCALELLDIDDPHAMHIDADILPLREGLLVYNPARVDPAALRKIPALASWTCKPYPFNPPRLRRVQPPSYMTSDWLVMNVLVLDPHTIVVDEADADFATFLRDECGMETVPCAFRHVNSLGGSFHCATVDLVRDAVA